MVISMGGLTACDVTQNEDVLLPRVGLRRARRSSCLLLSGRSGRSELKMPSHVVVAGTMLAVGSCCVCVGPEVTLEIDPELARKRTNTG